MRPRSFPAPVTVGGLRGWRREVVAPLRLVVAATAAWTLAALGVHDQEPVLAPVAAVLTVQGTVVATVRHGLQVCAGVLLGAAIGVALGAAGGNRWWTIALATAAGVAARYLPGLRGGPVNQIPTSALFVVALGQGYGYIRMLDTAVGAAVGVLVVLVLFPPVWVPESVGALGDLAADMSHILRDAAAAVHGPWDRPSAVALLHRARDLEDDLSRVQSTISEAAESLRFNPRKRSARSTERLRHTARALDHGLGQVRSITRSLADLASDGQGGPRDPPELPAEYHLLLGCAAATLDAYRLHLRGEGGADAVAATVAEGRDRARCLPSVPDVDQRQARLIGSIVEESQRLLGELGPDGFHQAAYG